MHESIKQEINERLATTEALMKQQLGIQFKDSVDKAEMDTFFRTHIALLMCSAYGENLRSQPGIVGKAENLYEMVVSGSFGLLNTDPPLPGCQPQPDRRRAGSQVRSVRRQDLRGRTCPVRAGAVRYAVPL